MVRQRISLYTRPRLHAGEERIDPYGYRRVGYEDRSCHGGALTGVSFIVDESYVATVQPRRGTLCPYHRPFRPGCSCALGSPPQS